jgi:ferredoxin--NADP+ reductase
MYVQDRLVEQMDTLWDLLQRSDTSLYICGLRGMEQGIDAAFGSHAEAQGVPWAPFRLALKQSGRLRVEVY